MIYFWAYIIISVGLGFVLGDFCTLPILWATSSVFVLIGAAWWITAQELEKLLSLAYGFFAAICLVTMWTTYYVTTNQTFIQDLFKNHIFR